MTDIRSLVFAEDDADDRLIFKDVLDEVDPGVSVQLVSNGVQLMDLLKHYRPDLLFLDLDMPYKNGLDCLVEIRRTPTLHDLPVVVFSSTTRPANIQTAYEMGANLFLIKASAMSEYSAAIKSILRLNWHEPETVREQYCVNGRYVAFS